MSDTGVSLRLAFPQVQEDVHGKDQDAGQEKGNGIFTHGVPPHTVRMMFAMSDRIAP